MKADKRWRVRRATDRYQYVSASTSASQGHGEDEATVSLNFHAAGKRIRFTMGKDEARMLAEDLNNAAKAAEGMEERDQ